LLPFNLENICYRESKDVFGSLLNEDSALEGIKKCLWFPTKWKKLISGYQKLFLIPCKVKKADKWELKGTYSFLFLSSATIKRSL
jgi:hypothetical protein